MRNLRKPAFGLFGAFVFFFLKDNGAVIMDHTPDTEPSNLEAVLRQLKQKENRLEELSKNIYKNAHMSLQKCFHEKVMKQLTDTIIPSIRKKVAQLQQVLIYQDGSEDVVDTFFDSSKENDFVDTLFASCNYDVLCS